MGASGVFALHLHQIAIILLVSSSYHTTRIYTIMLEGLLVIVQFTSSIVMARAFAHAVLPTRQVVDGHFAGILVIVTCSRSGSVESRFFSIGFGAKRLKKRDALLAEAREAGVPWPPEAKQDKLCAPWKRTH